MSGAAVFSLPRSKLWLSISWKPRIIRSIFQGASYSSGFVTPPSWLRLYHGSDGARFRVGGPLYGAASANKVQMSASRYLLGDCYKDLFRIRTYRHGRETSDVAGFVSVRRHNNSSPSNINNLESASCLKDGKTGYLGIQG